MTKLDPRERQKLINIIASIPEMQSDRGRADLGDQPHRSALAYGPIALILPGDRAGTRS